MQSKKYLLAKRLGITRQGLYKKVHAVHNKLNGSISIEQIYAVLECFFFPAYYALGEEE